MSIDIIGLGNCGCNIAEIFEQYPQYNVYKIDSEKRNGKFFSIKPEVTPEECEKKIPNTKKFFKNLNDDVIMIIGGSGMMSSYSLGILEQVKDKQITVVYVIPDKQFLGEMDIKINNLVYNVLQEYTRSGIFENMILIDNSEMETIIGEVPITEFYNKINQMIVTTLHMINVFKNTNPVMNNFSVPLKTTKIQTIGFVDFDTGEEKTFFNLENIKEKQYYYACNSKKIENDGSLLKKIKTHLKEINDITIKTTFGLYSTDYEENFIFCLSKSPNIQK